MSVPQKIGHPSIFVLLYLYCLIAAAGGLMFFLSHFKDFFIWNRQWYRWFRQPWARKNTHNCMPHCAVWMRLDLKMKVEWEKSYSKADLSKQKWNGTLSSSQYSETVEEKRKPGRKERWRSCHPPPQIINAITISAWRKKEENQRWCFFSRPLAKMCQHTLSWLVLCCVN